MQTGKRAEHGFAYVLLLAAIACIGISASASLSLGSAVARRDAEEQLLAIGVEFQRALHSYAAATPAGAPGLRTLNDLLKDPRVPGIKRHLRQIYADPLTGRQQWGEVKDSAGFIVAVHSLAEGKPVRQKGFAPELAGPLFESAGSYRSWVFGLPTGPAAGHVIAQPI